MNDLNSQQIVLLCLLVSFVTAIATGITVVSLLDQSPEPVTQTINRVVEKTIEKVVENPESSKPAERIVETVVVNQEDLTVDAVSKNDSSLVRIYSETTDGIRSFVGLGLVVSDSGQVLTDTNIISDSLRYVAVYKNSEANLNLTKRIGRIVLLDPRDIGDKKFSKATFGNSQNLKLAQSVILISGQSQNVVSTGVVTSLDTISVADTTTNQTKTVLNSVKTSVEADKVLTGSIIINLQGEIVGIRAGGDILNRNSFLPINIIKDALQD